MRRATGFLGIAAIVLFAAGISAQGKTNFSGKWSVDAEKTAAANPAGATGGGGGRGGGRAGGGGGAMGGGATVTVITQDAKTLKVERQGADGTAMGTAAVYNLDGSDSSNTQGQNAVVMNCKWAGETIECIGKVADTKTVYSMDGANMKVASTRPGRNGAAATTNTQVYKKG